MPTTLQFPQDLLRFLYWVFFKPSTLERYVYEINSKLSRNPDLFTLLWWSRAHPEFRSLIALALFHIVLTPWLIAFPVTGLFALIGFNVNWAAVAIGVAIGVAVGVVRGMTFSMADGVAFSVAISVAFSVAFGMMFGLAVGIAGSGMAFGAAVGVIGSSMAVGMVVGVIVGVAAGVATGVTAGVPAGVEAGMLLAMTWTVSFLLFYFRLPFYLIELPWQRIVGFFVATAPPERASRLFRLSPLYYDELIWLPLLGLDSALIEIGKKDRRLAQQAIADVAQSFRQGWAATNALIELTAYDVERAQDARAIANIAEQFAWLPPTMPRDLENVLPPLREIAQYAQAALESDTLYNKQTQLRAAIAQTQRVREGLALSRNRKIAARFGHALETWEYALRRELDALSAREIIPNVYVAGSPLATASKVFKGRRDLFLALERELATAAETRPTLLLFGARRCGKTSAIKQMPVRLGPDVIPVEVDLQSAATAEDASGLLFVLADQVRHNALTHRRVQLPPLMRDDLRADPYLVFGDWLNRVEEAVGTRWILLCLDEYERLEEMLEAGRIDQRVFHFLRHLIQHHPRLTVLLSGSHTLEDLSPMWSDYLINVRVLKIGNLKEDEARELIVQPIENFPLEYEPAAVERMIAVTGCQPYLVQATCRDLVNMLNEQNRTRATLADAERALDSALTTGALYFQELWRERDMDDTQRVLLRALATGRTLSALRDLPDLNSALRKLLRRDMLMETPQGYQFRVELVRRWVERHGDEP